VTLELYGNAGFLRAVGVGLAFIPKMVVLGGHDDGLGQASQARGRQGDTSEPSASSISTTKLPRSRSRSRESCAPLPLRDC
jgi:hypothetical protein